MKIACVYHFFEATPQHNSNLQYFIRKGLGTSVSHFFMLASDPQLSFPNLPNIHTLAIPNNYRDFGGYSRASLEISNLEWDYVFYLNSGMLGPFLRNNKQHWTDLYVERLDNETHVVGSTINVLPRPVSWSQELEIVLNNGNYNSFIDKRYASHVQTGVIGITGEAFKYLHRMKFFEQKIQESYAELVGNTVREI